MSQAITLDLTASFSDVIAPTPFGYYDSDADFITHANGMVVYTNGKFGGNIMDVELTNNDVYGCFEESMLEYSGMINAYQAKSTLADLIGSATGSLAGKENKVARMSLELAKRRSDAYSSEALVGGTRTLFSASITLEIGKQNYDMNRILSSSNVLQEGERAEIREVFHFSPSAAYRFFDTTSAVNYLHNEFSFESFTPETVFYLLPIWEDVLRAQQLEMSHKVRRSNYSFNVVGNTLKLYPVPTRTTRLHFTYFKVGSDDDSVFDSSDPITAGIANISNVPFGELNYSDINSIGKQWVRRYSLALSKEVLGLIRGKVSSIPIPNGDLTLNGPQLIASSREEQLALKAELRELLESMTYSALAEQERNEAEALQDQLAKVPMGIFMGGVLFFFTTYDILEKILNGGVY